METDTIAAIATAMTNSGIGIIRISGDEAVEIADKILELKGNKKKLANMESHTIHYGYVTDRYCRIDEVMVLLMRGPKSYTREDTVEIDCHGGVLVMRKILELVLQNGARPAEPGEFTKRAFLNGRIDLVQAESVIDIINAKNNFALHSSLEQLKGAVSDIIWRMRKKILHETAYIESALDDPEHISMEGYGKNLRDVLLPIEIEVEKLLDNAENGSILKEGLHTVIIGKPNAGKSSLLNTLVGKEKAIVTDIAGTTRDAIEEQINLNGISLNIIDTAGIRSTDDIIEKIGVDRAKNYVERADLIIYVVDSSTVLDQDDYEIIDLIKERKVLVLLNKSDLSQITTENDIKRCMNRTIIPISAKNNTGIKKLEEAIMQMFFKGELQWNDEVYITNIRHKNLMREVSESLKLVLKSIEDAMPEDFYSIDLMNAYEKLGVIIGEAVEDNLVNEIFSKFCLGK